MYLKCFLMFLFLHPGVNYRDTFNLIVSKEDYRNRIKDYLFRTLVNSFNLDVTSCMFLS